MLHRLKSDRPDHTASICQVVEVLAVVELIVAVVNSKRRATTGKGMPTAKGGCIRYHPDPRARGCRDWRRAEEVTRPPPLQAFAGPWTEGSE